MAAATDNLTATLQGWWSDLKKHAPTMSTKSVAVVPPTSASPANNASKPPPLGPFEASDAMLGEGGYARVVLGRHRETGEKVAIKLLDTRGDQASGRAASSESAIVREVAALRRAGAHPNICQLHGYYRIGEEGTHHAMVMELCKGGELFRLVEKYGAIDENKIRPIFNGVLAGLRHLHAQGIAHRDLKLENILLSDKTADAVPKIVDLGLAHVHARGEAGAGWADRALTQFCGSRSYCAPEVMARLGYNGYVADVWSLGVCLFGLVAGFFPVDEASPRDWRYERLARQQHVYPQQSSCVLIFSFYQRQCPLSPALVQLLDRMLMVAPAKRCSLDAVNESAWVHGLSDVPPTTVAGFNPPAAAPAPAAAASAEAPAAEAQMSAASPHIEIDITEFLQRSGVSTADANDAEMGDESFDTFYRSAAANNGLGAGEPPRVCRQRGEGSVGVANVFNL